MGDAGPIASLSSPRSGGRGVRRVPSAVRSCNRKPLMFRNRWQDGELSRGRCASIVDCAVPFTYIRFVSTALWNSRMPRLGGKLVSDESSSEAGVRDAWRVVRICMTCCLLMGPSQVLGQNADRKAGLEGRDSAAALAESLPGLSLPMPGPMILPGPCGDWALCVQGYSKPTEASGGAAQGPLVLLAVVDLARREVLTTRQLRFGKLRFAVGDEDIYVADNERLTLEVLSKPDLSTRSSQKLEQAVEGLVVIPGQLLCSTDGLLRLTLPDLRPSEKWAFVGRPQQCMPIVRMNDGWLIDGVLFDHELSRPHMLLAVPGRSEMRSLEPWGVEPTWDERDGVRLTYAVSYDCPVVVSAVRALRPSRDGGYEARVVAQALGGKVLAELVLGQIASIPEFRGRYGADNSGLTPVPHLGQSNIGLAFRGRQVLVTSNGRLIIWDMSDAALIQLPGGLRFERRQSSFTAEYGATTVLRHTLLGADGAAEFEFRSEYGVPVSASSSSFPLDLRAAVASQRNQNDRSYLMSRRSRDLRTTAPLTLKRLGVQPDGMVFAERVWVQAKVAGARPRAAALSYFILSVVSSQITEPIFAEVERRGQAQAARRKKEADLREMQARQLKQREESAKQRAVAQQGLVVAGRWAATLFSPLLVAIPFWVLCYAWPARRRMLTLLMAAAGTLPVVICLYLFARFLNKVELVSWERTVMGLFPLVTLSSVILLGLTYFTAIPLHMHAKSRGILAGIGLACLGPLGLLIAVLLPDDTLGVRRSQQSHRQDLAN